MGGSGEVASALTIYKWLTIYLEKGENQAVDEESPPTSLAISYLRKHNTYPFLVLLFASRRRRSSQGTHTLIKLFKIISVVVVYEQGVGLKSSITVDTASRKDLTLQGCTNCPLQGSARTPISLSCYP